MWQFGNNSCEDGAVFMRISITYADWIQQKSEYCYHSGQPKSDSSRQLRWVRSFRAKKMVKTFSCGHFSNENSVKPVIPSLFLLLTSFMIATKQENISRYIVSKWKYICFYSWSIVIGILKIISLLRENSACYASAFVGRWVQYYIK